MDLARSADGRSFRYVADFRFQLAKVILEVGFVHCIITICASVHVIHLHTKLTTTSNPARTAEAGSREGAVRGWSVSGADEPVLWPAGPVKGRQRRRTVRGAGRKTGAL